MNSTNFCATIAASSIIFSLAAAQVYNFPTEEELAAGTRAPPPAIVSFPKSKPLASTTTVPSCPNGPYLLGETCMGAMKKPLVEWCGCVSGASCTGPPGKEGYGATCVKSVEKCHPVGERCLGAPAFPYVHYGAGCCVDGSECIDADEEYGFKCSVPRN